MLGACLASLRGVADEIVVHDTGSTDGTVAIARAAGALVIEGSWDDDFAAARNVALDACRSTWILQLDADDVLSCDGRALRRALAATPASVDAFLIDIENLVDDGTGHSYTNRACRLFRRQRGHWQGRIHEQVRPRDGQPPLVLSTRTLPARMVHSGYLQDEIARQDKIDRNLRIAHAAVSASADASPELRLDLGRSLKAAGALDEAAEQCLAAAAAAPGTTVAASALHFAVSCLLGLGRVDDALAQIAVLRSTAARPAIADFLEAQASLQQGRPARALELLDGIDELVDDQGKRLASGVLPLHRGMALAGLERWQEAADAFAVAVSVHRAVRGNLALLVDALAQARRPIADLAGLMHDDILDLVIDELPRLTADDGNIVCRALWERRGETPGDRLIAAVAGVAPSFGLELAVDWSIRLREVGAARACPLLALSADQRRAPSLRVFAAATAVALGDELGIEAVAAAAGSVPEAMFTTMLVELNDLAPATLPAFVTGAAGTSRRGFLLGQALHRLGARDEGLAVIEAMVSGTDDPVVAAEALAWMEQEAGTTGTTGTASRTTSRTTSGPRQATTAASHAL